MRRVTKITKNEEKKIINIFLCGESIQSISKETGRAKQSIYNVLNKNGVKISFKDETLKDYGEFFGKRNVRKIPPKEEILLRFYYNKEEGRLISKKCDKEIKPDSKGYRVCHFGKFNGKLIRYKEHRLIFFLETGKQPESIDHIDGNRLNNHISNLREASSRQNSANSKPRKNCKSEYKGVTYDGRVIKKPWRSYFFDGEKSVYLGSFATEKEAAMAYNQKAVESHGEFAYPNLLIN